MQLIEPKPECKQPFQLRARQAFGELLPAQSRNLASVFVERSFEPIERWWRGSRGERTRSPYEICAAGRRDALQRSIESLGQRLGKRLHGRPSDDHEIMAQPEQGPRQRPGMGLRNEADQALAFRFRNERLKFSDASAGRILNIADDQLIAFLR